MKQFIYLDTDIISSIIAQIEQGIVTQVSYENTDSEEDHDEDKAKEMVDGILSDNKELVDKGDWGALVGVLEKGVAKKD